LIRIAQIAEGADVYRGNKQLRYFGLRSALLCGPRADTWQQRRCWQRRKKLLQKKTRRAAAAEIFFKEGLKRLKGKNVCFITNAAGLGRFFLYDAMEGTDKYIGAQLAKHEIRLAHLFTPEHGLTGTGRRPREH
jgi:hypothetical protein